MFVDIQTQLQAQPALVALRLASSDTCGSGRTLAIWESEAAMYSFVTSDAHATAMAAVHQSLQPSYAVTHWSASPADPTTFDYASKQLATKQASR
ncbi:MAG: hypothetical protein JWN04_1399 [Myxococcaceae bacterium]|nr:hypothetical protein [Myxococcaceae bacterium]